MHNTCVDNDLNDLNDFDKDATSVQYFLHELYFAANGFIPKIHYFDNLAKNKRKT